MSLLTVAVLCRIALWQYALRRLFRGPLYQAGSLYALITGGAGFYPFIFSSILTLFSPLCKKNHRLLLICFLLRHTPLSSPVPLSSGAL